MSGRDRIGNSPSFRRGSLPLSDSAVGPVPLPGLGLSSLSGVSMGQSLVGDRAAGNLFRAPEFDAERSPRNAAVHGNALAAALAALSADVRVRIGKIAQWRSDLAKFHRAE